MTSVTSRAPHRAWRRLVIGLVGVAALLVCLLAMNHGAGVSASGPGKVAAVQTVQSPEQVMTSVLNRGATPLSSEGCGVACAPHEVVAVACMLVLLVTVVLLAADLILTRRIFLRQILVTLVAKAATLAPPAPPSLYVLSISRI
ncbi:hypothetical protein [uncultured Schumannella sp.]|uniref:hypothetical protein n=1 Tax=uncultured Schumannella sp. TaxID=1195956 RepID=UPI0025E7E58F|nr:hypothetical protein [uncultured Schumannella sp.]